MYASFLLTNSTALVVVEFVTFNPNYGLYIYFQITFTMDYSGLMIPKINASAFKQNYYLGANAARALFELIYVMFVLYYAFIEFRSWREHFIILTEIDNKTEKKLPLPDNPNKCHRCIHFFKIDYRRFNNVNPVSDSLI